MTDGQTRGDTLSVERRSIDPIPDSERHGSVRNLFTVWFAANMQVTAVVTGALGVILGLPLPLGDRGPGHRQPDRRHIHGAALGAGPQARHPADDPEPGPVRLLRRHSPPGARRAHVRRVLRGQRRARRVRPGGLVGHRDHPGHDHRGRRVHGARGVRLPAHPPLRAVDQPGQRAGFLVSDDPVVHPVPRGLGLALGACAGGLVHPRGGDRRPHGRSRTHPTWPTTRVTCRGPPLCGPRSGGRTRAR